MVSEISIWLKMDGLYTGNSKRAASAARQKQKSTNPLSLGSVVLV
jgi:hypothetical protein